MNKIAQMAKELKRQAREDVMQFWLDRGMMIDTGGIGQV